MKLDSDIPFRFILVLWFVFCAGIETQQADGDKDASNTQFLLEDLKLKCGASKANLQVVTMTPFHGVIYPENQPHCRLYVGDGNTTFSIPLSPDGCGHHELFSDNFIEYRLAVQWDMLLVGPDDFLLVVRCEEQDSYNTTVTFEVSGDQLGHAHSQTIKQISPSVWMEIGNGWGPKSTILDHAVPAGTPLTLAVRLRATDAWFDVDIKTCKAGVPDENGDVDTEEGLILLDGSCSARPYFIGHTYKERRREDNTYVAYVFSHFTAFRFARSSLVEISCDVIVCFWRCPERPSCSDALVSRQTRSTAEANVLLPKKVNLQRTFVVQGIGQEVASIRDFTHRNKHRPHHAKTAMVMMWVLGIITFSILSIGLTIVFVRRCSIPPRHPTNDLFSASR